MVSDVLGGHGRGQHLVGKFVELGRLQVGGQRGEFLLAALLRQLRQRHLEQAGVEAGDVVPGTARERVEPLPQLGGDDQARGLLPVEIQMHPEHLLHERFGTRGDRVAAVHAVFQEHFRVHLKLVFQHRGHEEEVIVIELVGPERIRAQIAGARQDVAGRGDKVRLAQPLRDPGAIVVAEAPRPVKPAGARSILRQHHAVLVDDPQPGRDDRLARTQLSGLQSRLDPPGQIPVVGIEDRHPVAV